MLAAAPRLLWRHRRDIFISWDFVVSVGIGVAVGLRLPEKLDEAVLSSIAIGAVQLGAALLGVVLAGLAILAAFFESKHLLLLSKAGGGLSRDLFPFWFAGLITVIAALVGLVGLLATPLALPTKPLALAMVFTYTWALLAVFGLIRFVADHALFRAESVDAESGQSSAAGRFVE